MKKNQTTFMKLCLADALIKLMQTQDFDDININAICEKADIGRTTYYRHFDKKDNKEELLIFKIDYEWERYADEHGEETKTDKGASLTNFIYENRKLFFCLISTDLSQPLCKPLKSLSQTARPMTKVKLI